MRARKANSDKKGSSVDKGKNVGDTVVDETNRRESQRYMFDSFEEWQNLIGDENSDSGK